MSSKMANNAVKYELTDLNQALRTLQSGGLILYPTDTIWGIGCDATNAASVARIFALKQRDDSKALISIIHTDAMLPLLMKEVPPIAYDLIDAATRPLTIVYPDVRGLAENLLAEDGSAGIRIVQEEFCRKLCERFRKPIVSTSANISGEVAPSSFAEISEAVKAGVDYTVAYRQEERKAGGASTIIKLEVNGVFKILR